MIRASIVIPAALLATLALSSGCRTRAECTLGNNSTCSSEKICAVTATGDPACVARYGGRTPFARFPFSPNHPVICTRDSSARSDALFAIDLASPTETEPPGTVHAALEGTALVHEGCRNETRPGKANVDACGGGLGNHVRVLNADGFMVLYAHLGKVLVEDGQAVNPGDPIGIEGKSGQARKRHLRFSVHHASVDSWAPTLARYRKTPGLLPNSIPFETQFCDPSLAQECKRMRSRVEKMPCDPKQPRTLRADWR
jgi:hypothetical protein